MGSQRRGKVGANARIVAGVAAPAHELGGPPAGRLYPEWDVIAKELVANLRAESGRYPGDPKLAQLVGELSLASAEFRRLWATHTVREKAHDWKVVHNPIVGELRLRYETLRLPDDPDLALIVYIAEPASPTANALSLLASWITDPAIVEDDQRINRG